jgi:hypothetical protein
MNANLLNLILIIVFVVMIVAALLGGLIGFVKGIYKTTLKTIVKSVLVLVLIFITPALANAIGNINIQGILQTATATTIHSWIAQQITNSGLFSPINGLSLYASAIALANSILAYATFFLGAILIQILASPLTALLYNGIFRWILPVETNKERKLRKKNKTDTSLKEGLKDEDGQVSEKPKKKWHLFKLPGAILGAVQELLLVMIIITPLTALAHTAINNKQGINDTMNSVGVDNDTKSMITSYMETVEQSALYNTMASLGFDMVIMQQASTVNLNGTPVSLNGLIDSAFDVADPLLQNGTFSYDTGAGVVTINLSYLLSVSTVDALVAKLIANPMILALVPPVVDMAMNSISGNSFAIDELDFNDIDWASELSIVKSIYDAIYSTSIEPLINEEKFDFANFKLNTSTFSDEQIETYCNALSNLGSMESIKRNLGTILSSAGVYLNSIGYTIFPTEASAYETIDWSKEFYDLGNIIFRFMRTINMDISADFSMLTLSDNILGVMNDETKRNELQKYICGSDDFSGLIDTKIFSILSFPDVLASSLSIVPAIQPYIKAVDINQVLKGYEVEDYRTELNTIFELLGMLYDDSSKIKLEDISSLDLMDEETVSQLANLLETSENSKIFSSIYPSVMKTFLFNNSFDFSDYLFGLTPYNFNYESADFISNLTELLRMMPRLQELKDTLGDSSLSLAEKFNSIDSSLIKDLLTIVTTSDFFNSNFLTGVTSYRQKNVNIYIFLSNLFSNAVFSNFTITVPNIDELQDVIWVDQGSVQGEISVLCNLIDEIKKNPEFITSETHSVDDIKDTDAISNIIKGAMTSKILAPSVLELIDASLGSYLEDMGIHMSLNEIRTSVWVSDADRIGQLLGLLQGIDFSDIKSLSTDRFNAILTILYQFEFLKESNDYEDYFGYCIYNMIQSQDFYAALGMETPDIYCFNVVGAGQKWIDTTKEVELSRKISETVTYTDTYTITLTGEIADLCNFIDVVQDYGFDAIEGGKLPDGFIDATCDLLSSHIIKHMFCSFLNEILSQIHLEDTFNNVLGSIDFNIFQNLSKEDASYELQFLNYLYQLDDVEYEGQSKLIYMTKHIYELRDKPSDPSDPSNTKTLFDDFNALMDYLKYSKLMNTLKDGYQFTPVGYFYQGLFRSNGLLEQVTLETTSTYQEIALKGILLEVDDFVDEITCLQSIIDSLQGLDANFSLGVNLNYDSSLAILTEMNKSQVFHRFPIYLLKQAMQGRGIEDYLVMPGTTNIPHPLNWDIHLETSTEDIAYWQNDIEHLVEMMLGSNGLTSVFTSGSSSFDDIDLSSDSFHLDFFYHIGATNLFKESRSYLLYNLIQKHAQDGFDISKILKEATTAPYGENKAAYRFEELYFQNPKLIDSNGEMIKEKALNDVNMLKSVLSIILEKIASVSFSTDLSSLDIDFEAINDATVSFTDGVNDNQFYRSDLASEFVAGLENQLIHNANLTYFFSELSDIDFYADDYLLVNTIEGRGLNGIIGISKLNLLSMYQPVASLQLIFDNLGADSTLVDIVAVADKDKLNYFLGLSTYSSSGNSSIAVKEYALLSYLTVKTISTNEIKTLSNVITDFNATTLATHSFSSLLRSVASDLQ